MKDRYAMHVGRQLGCIPEVEWAVVDQMGRFGVAEPAFAIVRRSMLDKGLDDPIWDMYVPTLMEGGAS